MENPQDQASASTPPSPSRSDEPSIAELQALVEAKRTTMLPLPMPETIPIAKATGVAIERRCYRELPEESDHRRKDRERNGNWDQLVRSRGVRYEKCRLDNFHCDSEPQRVAVASLSEYVASIAEQIVEGVNVVLIGPAGTGKDHLLMALCHAAIGVYRKVEWVNGTSLWLKFRSAIGDEDRDECSIVRELTRPDVLAISDPVPPRGPLTDYQASMLFDVIDSRYSHRKPVWVTLNCANRKEAEERMGVQVVDRIAHDALIVACNWPSYRKSP